MNFKILASLNVCLLFPSHAFASNSEFEQARICAWRAAFNTLLTPSEQLHGAILDAKKIDQVEKFVISRLPKNEKVGFLSFLRKREIFDAKRPDETKKINLEFLEQFLDEKDPVKRRVQAQIIEGEILKNTQVLHVHSVTRLDNKLIIKSVPDRARENSTTSVVISGLSGAAILTGGPVGALGGPLITRVGSILFGKLRKAVVIDLEKIWELSASEYRNVNYQPTSHNWFRWFDLVEGNRALEGKPLLTSLEDLEGISGTEYLRHWNIARRPKSFLGMQELVQFIRDSLLGGIWIGKFHPENLIFKNGQWNLKVTGAESARLYAYQKLKEEGAILENLASDSTEIVLRTPTKSIKTGDYKDADELIFNLTNEGFKDSSGVFTIPLGISRRIAFLQIEADMFERLFWGENLMKGTVLAQDFAKLRAEILGAKK